MLLKMLGFLALVGIGYGIYRFLLAHKRSLTLTIADEIVPTGEPIRCTLVLENAKIIQSKEISLTLVGTREVRENRGGGSGKTVKEVHRSRHLVVGMKTYSPKNRSEYQFDIPAPGRKSSGNKRLEGSELAAELKSNAQAIDNRTEWVVEARLDGNGVTLKDKQTVKISG